MGVLNNSMSALKMAVCAIALATGMASAQGSSAIFATVGPDTISVDQFQMSLRTAARNRFYHGQAPEGGVAALREEIGRGLVTRSLLLQEAARRQIGADEAAIQAQLDAYDQRYKDSPRWQQQREAMLANVSAPLREDSILERLEAQVRQVAPPSAKQLQAYYQANPDKFTEPSQDRVSVILLRVDPSSSSAVWDAAGVEGEKLAQRLAQGESFEELAHMHSADTSAEQGGDMGYLHQGMLSEGAQAAVNALAVSEVSAPIRLLEGVAIFRLEDRKPARLRDFADVRDRARGLWLRDQGDAAWSRLKDKLWAETPIDMPGLRVSAAASAPTEQ